jgi:tetratricopeptide (TPR) repeat protein
MFKLIPQIIVLVSAVIIILIVLRRLPQVTIKEESGIFDDKNPAAGETGAGFWSRFFTLLKEFFVRIYHNLANFVNEAKDHTVKAHYLERVSHVLKIKGSNLKARRLKQSQPQPEQSQPAARPTEAEDRTEEMLIKIIESDPANRSAYEGLGKLYLEAKKFKDALEVYAYLTKVYPNEDKYISKLGLVNFNLGNYDAAIEAYQKALELAPNTPHRLINLSLCYEAKGQMNDAVTSVKRALEKSPEDVQYLLLLSDFLVREGQNAAALEVLEKILQLEPTNHVAREKLMQLKF